MITFLASERSKQSSTRAIERHPKGDAGGDSEKSTERRRKDCLIEESDIPAERMNLESKRLEQEPFWSKISMKGDY